MQGAGGLVSATGWFLGPQDHRYMFKSVRGQPATLIKTHMAL